MGRGLAWVGLLIFGVSWFVPVVRQQAGPVVKESPAAGVFDEIFVDSDAREDRASPGPRWLPGWRACRYAWELLVGRAELNREGKEDWKRILLGATCLTNVLMILTVPAVLRGGGRRRLLGSLLLAAAVLDSGWLYLPGGEVTMELRAGYYLWAGSFAFVGLGLVLSGGRGVLHPPKRT